VAAQQRMKKVSTYIQSGRKCGYQKGTKPTYPKKNNEKKV